MIASLLAVLVMSVVPFASTAPASAEPELVPIVTEYDLSTEIGGTEYACRVYVNRAAERGGAALLFLHGYGECGTDGVRMRHVGLPRYADIDPELWPFVIIAPQKPIHESEWEDHAKAVFHFLDTAAEHGLYDPERLAITGLSQGGHGTIAIAAMDPERFACAAPVCGYVERVWDDKGNRGERQEATPTTPAVVKAARALSVMPVWVHHGEKDSVVPVEQSRALSVALKEQGADTRYSEYEGVDHNSWDNAYIDPALSAWFKKHLSE